GLVARDGEQDYEERELDIVKGFAVDVGLDQPGDDVVLTAGGTPLASWGATRLRGTAALLGHAVGVAHQLSVGGGISCLEVRIVVVHDRVGPTEQLLAIGSGTPMRSAMASSGRHIAM